MTEEAQKRKAQPVYSGVLKYFPRAIRYVAEVSRVGNEQHHPGSPLHWDMSKSRDEEDAMVRHLMDHAQGNIYDTDGLLHLGKTAWRALGALERFLIQQEDGKTTA